VKLITQLDDERLDNPSPVDRIKLYRDSLRYALECIKLLRLSERVKMDEIERITFEADRIRATNEDCAALAAALARAEEAEKVNIWLRTELHDVTVSLERKHERLQESEAIVARIGTFIEGRLEHCVSDQRGAYQDVLNELFGKESI